MAKKTYCVSMVKEYWGPGVWPTMWHVEATDAKDAEEQAVYMFGVGWIVDDVSEQRARAAAGRSS